MSQVNINEIISQPGSERAIISTCLQDPTKIIDCESSGLKPDQMSVEAHRYIYMAVAYLFNQNQNVDALSVYNVLTDATAKKALEEIGGMEYVEALYQAPISQNINLFCQQIKEAYTKRQIYIVCTDTAEQLLRTSDTEGSENLLAKIEKQILDINLQSMESADIYRMGSDTLDVLDQRANHPTDIIGIPLGMPKLDKAIGGARPGDLIIVAAESKTGKSVTLLNWAKHIVIDLSLPLLYIDTEMYSREQEDRLLSIISQVPEKEIENGQFALDPIKTEKVRDSALLLRTTNFYHTYMPDFSVDKIHALVRKFQMQHQIAAVIFDYIQLPSSQLGTLKFAREDQLLKFQTAGLKDIAGLCQIPILAAAQENRSGLGSTKKDASNLGGSYGILQKASKLLFLRNKTDEELAKDGPLKGNQVIEIAYQRKGESGSDAPKINIMFNKPVITQREI